MYGIARNENGNEEWQSLYVIPMAMRVKNMCGDGEFFEQFLCKSENPGAAVQYDQLLIVSAYLNTGCIAAITLCVGSGGGYGTAYAPEFYFHLIISLLVCANAWASATTMDRSPNCTIISSRLPPKRDFTASGSVSIITSLCVEFDRYLLS